MKRAMRKGKQKPQKQRSRILNLMALALLVWLVLALSGDGGWRPVPKMLLAYISWGLMIYLLMGFFFVRRPSRSIALLGAVAALGAGLGSLDLTSFGATPHIPILLVIIIPLSMICYLTGILSGWLLESLLKALWRQTGRRRSGAAPGHGEPALAA